jgi:hypothetical protein
MWIDGTDTGFFFQNGRHFGDVYRERIHGYLRKCECGTGYLVCFAPNRTWYPVLALLYYFLLTIIRKAICLLLWIKPSEKYWANY